MSLDDLVSLLLEKNSSHSVYSRAIRLFEFQVAVFYPISYSKMLASDDLHAATRRLRTARIYAGIKFLEDIEAELCKKTRSAAIPLQKLAKNPIYCDIYDRVIATNGGWMRIRRSISEMSFDNNLIKRGYKADTAVKIVDVSYRFAKTPNLKKRRGILHAAQYVVRDDASYRPHYSKDKFKDIIERTEIKKRWRIFAATSIFLYLLRREEYSKLAPPRIASKDFSKILLRQAKDIHKLRHFFQAYQTLCKTIGLYRKFEIVHLDFGIDVPSLSWSPIAAKVIDDAFETAKRERE
jgi:hypothetical protein